MLPFNLLTILFRRLENVENDLSMVGEGLGGHRVANDGLTGLSQQVMVGEGLGGHSVTIDGLEL